VNFGVIIYKVFSFQQGENIMDTKPVSIEETKKVWVTPELIVHGDVEKITKESHHGLRGYPEGS
jgi:hypothetical protein